MFDQYKRKIDYLRISVTDKCNFRCVYCMPKEGVSQLCHQDILTFEEIVSICKCAVKLGIHKIKITGGEPLLRKDLEQLIRMIHDIEGIHQITMTTNGYYLEERVEALKEAGITGINISIDTLDEQIFENITRSEGLQKVICSLRKAVSLQIPSVKVNCVPMKQNAKEIWKIAALAKKFPVHVRFIEMMPIGLGGLYRGAYQDELLGRLERIYGTATPCRERLGNGPASYYSFSGFQGKIGFISAMSHEFCETCNRIRITADGYLKPCLNYNSRWNLRDVIRSGASEKQLTEYMYQAIFYKPLRHGFLELEGCEKEARKMAGIGG